MEVLYVQDAAGERVSDRQWQYVIDALPRALDGDFPIYERLAAARASEAPAAAAASAIATSVQVDNVSSERYSIVEVTASDRVGLLYAIARTLRELALDIHAKVNTVGHEVVDTFFVRRTNGSRVAADDEIERLQQRVVAAIAALEPYARTSEA